MVPTISARFGTPEQRFWSHVTKTETCWLWSPVTAKHPYGTFKVGSKRNKKATHFSYELHCGPIPDGLLVCHTCDNPRCVRPDHLFLGTHSDNMRDAKRKGRRADRERHRSAKINSTIAASIRERRMKGEGVRALAREFRLSHSTVCQIIAGTIWASREGAA